MTCVYINITFLSFSLEQEVKKDLETNFIKCKKNKKWLHSHIWREREKNWRRIQWSSILRIYSGQRTSSISAHTISKFISILKTNWKYHLNQQTSFICNLFFNYKWKIKCMLCCNTITFLLYAQDHRYIKNS